MTKKPKIFLCIILTFIIVIVSLAWFVFFGNLNNHNKNTHKLVINNRNELTSILGFDFSSVNISDIYTDDRSNCICVVLDMDYAEFSKDPITENDLFYKEDIERSLISLKKVFPNTFINSIENIEDGNGTLQTYEFKHEEYIEDVPYYIQWFSIEEPNEKCLIYAFLPEGIESITVTQVITQVDGSLV